MSVFLASFAKYFWKRQPQIWFLVALKLKCQPDIGFLTLLSLLFTLCCICYKILCHLPVVGELGKAEACWCCCDEEAVVHGQHRQHFSKGFLKSKFELIQRLKFLSTWMVLQDFNFCTKCMKRCRFEDLCNRFSCTQLMLTTIARSSGHFLKSKRLEGFLPSTNTSELPKSPRSLQRLICFPLFHHCNNCKCFSLSKFHMLIIILVKIFNWKYKDTAALCSDWLVMTISG